jgi:hypothetical protein
MSTIDPNTLDPEQIRKLPLRFDLPLNGLTEEQQRAIGADPAEVEAARLANQAWRSQRAEQEATQLAVGAATLVQDGLLTEYEAAQMLLQQGEQRAHALFVQAWREEEAREAAELAASDLEFADAETYAEHFNEQLASLRAETVKAEQEAKEAADALLAGQIRARVDATVPVGHPLRAGIEAAIAHQLSGTGELPKDADAQKALVADAVQRTVVLSGAQESIREQAEQEWRVLRKGHGKSGDLMTRADIARAKEHYIAGRLQQLGESTMIAHADLKAPPTADEERERYVERFSARNGASQSFHNEVAAMAQRGREAEQRRHERGTSDDSGSERDQYREAVHRAESTARVGEPVTTENAPQATSRNPDRPDLPPDWPDEFGPALG